jgi:hypothetical protein
VRPHKRFLLLIAFAAMLLVGFAAPSQAQGHGHGGGVHGGAVVVVRGGYYAPYYDPFFYADPWYGYQYPYPYPPYAYAYRPIAPDSSVRLEVKPKNAEVYVDGYYAGVVDDFDGTFQRLRVEPGEHEIELWLEGYRTVRQKVFLTPDNTFRIKYTMEPLGGQAQEPKPQPLQPEGGYQPRAQQPQQPMGPGPSTRRMPPPPPQQQPPQQPPPNERRGSQGNASYGTLAIRVQPGDAEVSIDGEPWHGPANGDRLLVDVAEGSHTVEIRKPGYRTYVTQIDVRRGQTTPVNVSLRGEQP